MIGGIPLRQSARDLGPLATAAAAALAIITLLVLVYPTVYVLIGSFKPGGGLLSQAGAFTFENYLKIFRSGFSRFILNSLVICATATLVSTLLSTMATYAFSRFDFPILPPYTRLARFIRGEAPTTAMLRGFMSGVRSIVYGRRLCRKPPALSNERGARKHLSRA